MCMVLAIHRIFRLLIGLIDVVFCLITLGNLPPFMDPNVTSDGPSNWLSICQLKLGMFLFNHLISVVFLVNNQHHN